MTKPRRKPLSFKLEGTTTMPLPSAPAQTKELRQERLITTKAMRAKSRKGRQFIAAHVVPEAAKQFKLLSVQQDRTTQSMLIEAINDLFTKYGLSRIADE
jgi:hypothetical protein